MLTVINQDGTFSGVQYYTDEQRFRDHHAALGQACIWIGRKIDGEKPGVPAKEDLDANTEYEKALEMKRINEESVQIMRPMVLGKATAKESADLTALDDAAKALTSTAARAE